MKRYKDCSLRCVENQDSISLLDLVTNLSKAKGYKIERYATFYKQDTLAVYMTEPDLPYSRLIVSATKDSVDIVNIIPMRESGISHIDYAEYNKLLGIFRDKVFTEIRTNYGNIMEETTEDYSIEGLIPHSFSSLDAWLNNYPLSGHPLDERRWYAFVVALHVNHEDLSTSDFRKYIQEKYGWSEEVIESFSRKLESQKELLKYYDEHRED